MGVLQYGYARRFVVARVVTVVTVTVPVTVSLDVHHAATNPSRPPCVADRRR